MAAQPNDDDQTDVERFETRTDISWTSFGNEQDVRSQDCPLTNETDDTSHSGSQKGHGPQLAENEPPCVLVEPSITEAMPNSKFTLWTRHWTNCARTLNT